MKSKLFLLLMVAMLLLSVSVKAQITETEIQKTDVNGDGNVDVADINGIIDIIKNLGKPKEVYKYYLGVVTDEQLNDDDYLFSLIQQSTSTFFGLPTTLKLPTADSDDKYVVWIYDSSMGRPTLHLGKWSVGWWYGFPNHPEYEMMWTDKAKMYGNIIDEECRVDWRSHRPNGANNGLSAQDGDINEDGIVNHADIEVVNEMMKKVDVLNKSQVGYKCYLGVTSHESFTEEDLNKTVLARPTKITSKSSSGANFNVWIYPASWGKPKSAISSSSNAETIQAFNYRDLIVPDGYLGAWWQDSSSATYTLTW